MGDLARLLCQYASKSIGASGICRSGCWISRSRGSLGRVAWVLTSLQFTQSSLTCRTHRTDLVLCRHALNYRKPRHPSVTGGTTAKRSWRKSKSREDVSMSWAASMGDAVVAHAPVAAALRGCAFRSDFSYPHVLGYSSKLGRMYGKLALA